MPLRMRQRKLRRIIFYDQLQKIVDEVPRHDMLSVVGDWNAKVGEQVGEKGIVGKFGMA